MFLTRTNFELAAAGAGIVDLEHDGEQYLSQATQAAYLVWLSVARPSTGLEHQPSGWIRRRKGRQVALQPHRPTGPDAPNWSTWVAKGWDVPMPVYANVPSISPAELAVLMERRRQRHVEGYSLEHDRQYLNGELARAAASYAIQAAGQPTMFWPWPWPDNPIKACRARESLVKAGALIVAALEALDADAKTGAPGASR